MANQNQIEEAVCAGIYVRLHPRHKLSKVLKIKYLNNEYFKMGRCLSLFDAKPKKKIPTLAQAQRIFARIKQRNELDKKEQQ